MLIALATGSATHAASAAPVVRPLAAAQMRALGPKWTPASSALTYTTIDDGFDPTFNRLLGIDDNGVISGYFGGGGAGHPSIGYTVAPPYNTFDSDSLPSSTQTQPTGITPGGTTSGFWAPTNIGIALGANYGFVRLVRDNGVKLWLSVNDPLVSSSPKLNQVLGVNSHLSAAGFYNDANNNSHGFVYSISTGTFSHPFNDAHSVSNAVTGINDHNAISGFFSDTNGNTKGFVQSLAGGTSVHYLVPGKTFTQFLGLNNENEAVGWFIAGGTPQGLVYNVTKNELTIVNGPPGSIATLINGINDKHQAVGFYIDANGNSHGLLVGNVP